MTTKEKVVTDEQYGRVAKRTHELLTRFAKGAVDFQPVMDGLQLLIEGKSVVECGLWSCPYPQGFRIRTVQEQLEVLTMFFPNLDASHAQELASGDLPAGAEGWAVIPRPNKFGTYHGALGMVVELISKNRKFKNMLEGNLTDRHLRLTEKTKQVQDKLTIEQPGDYMVFPFQFGNKWRGDSVRDARFCFEDNEFGLGPYEVAILLLTHPDRITGRDQLIIDCAGGEYRPSAKGAFVKFLFFGWRGCGEGQFLLYYEDSDIPNKYYGVASGFLPK